MSINVKLKGDIIRNLLELNRCKIKGVRNEYTPVGANSTVNLANLAGSGTVLALWLAVDAGNAGRDGKIVIYNDGESTPSVDIDIGTLACAHWVPVNTPRQFSVKHLHMETIWNTTKRTSMVLKFLMPFGNGIKIDFVNPTSYTGTLWSQVYYTNDFTLPLRLKGAGTTWLNKKTVPAGGSFTFIDVSGFEGWLLYHSLVAVGASNLTGFVESDVAVYIDGESTPSIYATGTEDWLTGSFSFEYWAPYYTPWFACVVKDATYYSLVACIDLLELLGGIHFNNAVKMVWDCSESNTNVDISYCVLYYKKV
jgi:hypothetical protein